MKRIYCNVEKCVACRACELACAVAHSTSHDLLVAVREEEQPRHRIRVRAIDGEGLPAGARAIAIQCRHCDEPPCIKACTEGCIHKDEATGAVAIDSESCTGCWVCVKACPYGAIVRHRGLRKALICDHCAGRDVPACVEACRTGALVFCDSDENTLDYAELIGL